MAEWRPEEGWENPYQNDPNIIPTVTTTNLQGTKNLMHNAYEVGADAIVAALLAHLRATAKQNLDLAQSIINEDNALAGTIPWQLGRDATAYLVVADYIEKGQIRPWGMDDITAVASQSEG